MPDLQCTHRPAVGDSWHCWNLVVPAVVGPRVVKSPVAVQSVPPVPRFVVGTVAGIALPPGVRGSNWSCNHWDSSNHWQADRVAAES